MSGSWVGRVRGIAWTVACASLLACGEGSGRPPEEDAPAAEPVIPWLAAGSPEIAPPVVPWLGGDPITRACPSGWRESPRRSGVACEPWPESGRATCTGASAHRPGDEGCRPIGAPCPSGDFAEGLPAGAIHVRAGASGTTGTAADPVGTVAEALALAGTGGVVALARGSHTLESPIGGEVELRGACAEATRITGTLATIGGTLTIRDAALGALDVEGGTVRASGVWIEDATGAAIDVARGTLILEDSVVRGGLADAGGASFAVRVFSGRLEASRIAIEGARWRGVFLTGGASGSIDGSVIADTRAGVDGYGIGVFAQSSAGPLALARSVVEGGEGALVAVEGGTGTLEDVLLQRATARPGETFAFGLAVHVALTGHGIQVRDVAGIAIAVAAGHAELEDVIVESALPGAIGVHSETAGELTVRRVRAGPIAIGLQAFNGGHLDASDALVFEGTDHGLVSRGDGATAVVRRLVVENGTRGVRAADDSSLTLEDAVIRDLESTTLGDDAIGVFLRSVVTARRVRAERVANSCFVALQEQSRLVIEDASCTGGTELGVLAAGEGSIDATRLHVEGAIIVGIGSENGTVYARDVLVEEIGPSEQVSSGASAIQGGELTLERARLVAIHGYAGASSGVREGDGAPSRIALTDVAIDGADLGGVVAEARAELVRVSIDGASELGISSATATGSVHLEDVSVRDVGSRDDDGLLGRGVHVGEGAQLDGARLVIESARGAGLIVAGAGSTADLEVLWVSDTLPEACADRCAARAGGSGVVVSEGGTATIASLRSWGHAVAGVQVAGGGALDLHGGWVFGNPIGRSVLSAIARERLTDGVIYVDNDVEESASSVSVPSSSLF